MYNGIGLQTARGSGTNGYVQTNKFFVKPKTGKVAHNIKGFEADQGTAGISRKPNKDILEHDRKRQIELKLVVLEDKLIDQGYTDAEIKEKIDEARKTLQAAAASEESGGPASLIAADSKVSDTQSHQIAARKEKQMETFRAALGIAVTEPGEISDDGPLDGQKSGLDDNSKWRERREHAFLDRDFSRKKHTTEDAKVEKDVKTKNKKERDEVYDSSDTDGGRKRSKVVQKKHSKHRRGSHSENDTDSDSDSDYNKKKRTTKKHKESRRHGDGDDDTDLDNCVKMKGKEKSMKRRRHDSDSDYSASSGDSDSDSWKKTKTKSKISEKPTKSRRHESDGGSSDTDDSSDFERKGKRKIKPSEKYTKHRRHDSGSDSDSEDSASSYSTESSDDEKTKKKRSVERPVKNSRHDSETSDSDDGKPKKRTVERPSKGKRHDSDSSDASFSDCGTDSQIGKKGASEKLKSSRMHGNHSNDSMSDEDVDVRKVTSKQNIEEYKKAHKRRDYDGGSNYDLYSSKDKTVEAKQHNEKGGQHDSEDDTDIDGGVQRNNSASDKLKSQRQGRSETVRGDINFEDRWKSSDLRDKNNRTDILDVEPQRESKANDRNYERQVGDRRHTKEEGVYKRGRYERNDDYGRHEKDDDHRRGSRRRIAYEEEERGRKGCDGWDYEDRRREKRHRRDEEDYKEKRFQKDEEYDDRYGRHGKVDEDQRYESRRHGKGEKEEHGARSHDKEKQIDDSKRMRYDDSRSNERRRYEDDKRSGDRGRYRD